MTEEHKAWLARIEQMCLNARLTNTVEAYESTVDSIQQALDTCPEP